jgi:hypothetical protein
MLITCSLDDCTYYVCIHVSLFVGIYVWLNWTTLLFISKFLLFINQSVHPLMIYNHFSSSHHSSHYHPLSPIPFHRSIYPSIPSTSIPHHSSPLHHHCFPSSPIIISIHLIHSDDSYDNAVGTPSTVVPWLVINAHGWEVLDHSKTSLVYDLKLGNECCSTDSISFHYLKVVHYLGCVVYRVNIISSYKLLL